MENVLEEMNRNLLMEVYEIKKQLKYAEEAIGSERLQKFQLSLELNDLKVQLRQAQERIFEQDKTIATIHDSCNQLYAENLTLKQNKLMLESILHVQAQNEALKQIEALNLQTTPEEEMTAPEHHREQHKEKYSTIASKLNLTSNDFEAPKKSAPEKVDPSTLRLFVGHLSPQINEDNLKEYFSKFGEVVDVFFPRDGNSHRGFGFVTLSHYFGTHPMKVSPHILNGRKLYLDLSVNEGKNGGDTTETKVLMVSGIIQEISTEDLKKHFTQYGTVVDVVRSKENKNKFSRWAFIIFNDSVSLEKALKDPFHSINGHSLDYRRAKSYKPEVTQVEKTQPENYEVAKLCLHNLNPKTTTDAIKKYFSKYGTVIDAYIPTFYGTDASKCFGYIVMPRKDTNFETRGHLIDGNLVHISYDTSHQISKKSSTLLISAGPEVMGKISEKDLEKFFAKFGTIKSVRKPGDPNMKKNAHYAFVEYSTTEAVDKAMKNLSYKIAGHIVCVTKALHEPHK